MPTRFPAPNVGSPGCCTASLAQQEPLRSALGAWQSWRHPTAAAGQHSHMGRAAFAPCQR